jgi:hypothetical protein
MKNINESFSINSLTRQEVKTILESLLFASSCDVGGSFYKEESLSMFEIAKKIRTMFPDVLLTDINITPVLDENNQEVYHDDHTGEIVKFFPEVLEEALVK